jgi:hypothetical protein
MEMAGKSVQETNKILRATSMEGQHFADIREQRGKERERITQRDAEHAEFRERRAKARFQHKRAEEMGRGTFENGS